MSLPAFATSTAEDGRVLLEGFFPRTEPDLETVAAAAAQSYCVFYPFDLNRRGISVEEGAAASTTLATEIHARLAPLGTLAVETGGTLLIDAAARPDALRALADRAQDYYLIGFEPSPEAAAARGKYRRVTVRVKRPGVSVSARTGYTLAPLPTAADRRTSIDAALGAPFVQQGLKIDYTTYILKARETGLHRVVLSLTADLPVRAQSSDTADVVFVARDVRDGRVVASGTDVMRLPTAATPGATLGTGAWRVQFNVPAGTYLMRTVVREPGGLVGSADRRLDVRPLDGPEMAVSDLVVGSTGAGLPVRPRAYTGDGLAGLIETYSRTAAQMDGLEIAIELRGAHAPAAVSFQADIQEPETDGAAIVRRARFLLPLTAVPPGDYLAHATSSSRGGRRRTVRQVEIVEGEPRLLRWSPSHAVPPAESSAASGPEIHCVAAQAGNRDGLSKPRVMPARIGGNMSSSPCTTSAGSGRRSTSATRAGGIRARGLCGAAAALARRLCSAGQRLTAFFLGWAREGAGDTRAAIGAWRNAAHLDPTTRSAHLALAEPTCGLLNQRLRSRHCAPTCRVPDSIELRERLARVEQLRLPPSPPSR